MSGPADEPVAPAEARVRDLLSELGSAAAPPAPGTDLVPRVARTARWQRVVRDAVAAAGHLVGAVADGLSTLLRRRA